MSVGWVGSFVVILTVVELLSSDWLVTLRCSGVCQLGLKKDD